MPERAIIIENDKRMNYLKEMLSERFETESYRNGMKKRKNDIMILPLPCSRDNETINGTDGEMKFEDIKEYLRENAVVFGGKIPEKLKITLAKDKIMCYDYFSEITEQKNASATAEGTVGIIIANTSEVLSGMKILLIGYGRITGYLSKLLKAFNVSVTIATTDDVRKVKADLNGFKSVKTDSVSEKIRDFDVIVNTSSYFRLDSDVLSKSDESSKETLYIELAGKYSDVEIKDAQKNSIKIVCAYGVPPELSS